MELEFKDELIVEESNFRDLKRIAAGYDSIEFSNSLGIEVNSKALADYLCAVEGIDQIQTLSINYSSQLKNLMVIKAFPNLRYLNIYGYQITSLDGLEWFQQGEFIHIWTESNHRRRISKIPEAPIKRLILQYARAEDLEDIAECLTLNDLEISRSRDLNFSKWTRVPLESLSLKKGKFKELGNTADVSSLKSIWVLGCRSLERFTGDNSRISRLLIEGCKKLDLRTIHTFQGIESLIVNGNPNEIGLTEIGEFKKLESLSLLNCKVQVDTADLKRHFPRLKELYISNMKKAQAIELKQFNPDIVFTGDSFESV